MNIKVKKKNSDGIVKMETSGKFREIIIKKDFLKPKNTSLALCFIGKQSSGIVEMTEKELEDIFNEIKRKKLDGVKIMKLKK